MYDPELYRDKQEVEQWRQRDPIDLLEATMTERGELPEGARQELEEEARAEVADAVEAAEAGSLEPVETLTRFVCSDAHPGQEAST
jgi:pyruvate dehydrogenase E1 component alpha subunit